MCGIACHNFFLYSRRNKSNFKAYKPDVKEVLEKIKVIIDITIFLDFISNTRYGHFTLYHLFVLYQSH